MNHGVREDYGDLMPIRTTFMQMARINLVYIQSLIHAGYINDKSIKLTVSEKEDFEDVLLCLRKVSYLKRCGFGIKTNYWKKIRVEFKVIMILIDVKRYSLKVQLH